MARQLEARLWEVRKYPSDHHTNIKVNKKTLTYKNSYGGESKLYTSEEEINQECWLNINHYKISQEVYDCKDYDIVKQIADIIGYKE